jgi:hypothetical protein
MLLKIFLFNNILKLLFFIFLNLFLLSTQQTTHKNTKKKKKLKFKNFKTPLCVVADWLAVHQLILDITRIDRT